MAWGAWRRLRGMPRARRRYGLLCAVRCALCAVWVPASAVPYVPRTVSGVRHRPCLPGGDAPARSPSCRHAAPQVASVAFFSVDVASAPWGVLADRAGARACLALAVRIGPGFGFGFGFGFGLGSG